MNRSGSHPNYEKRKKIIISTVLIRRGGAPSGAAGFIVFGGMGVSTPISNSGGSTFRGNHLILIMTLPGTPLLSLGYPPGRYSAVLPVHNLEEICGKSNIKNTEASRGAPAMETGLPEAGDNHYSDKRIF